MAQVTCIECGVVVEAPPSRAKGMKYCSWACRTAKPRICNAVPLVLWWCEFCGEAEMRQPSRANRRFCSMACRDASVRANGSPKRLKESWVSLACQTCATSYTVHRSKLGRSKFCSRACANLGRPLPAKTSKIASECFELLRRRHPGLAIEQERRMGRWSIDIALVDHMVAIEIDGAYWHSLPGIAEKDKRKDAFLADQGWRVERFTVEREPATQVVALIEERLALYVNDLSQMKG